MARDDETSALELHIKGKYNKINIENYSTRIINYTAFNIFF